MCRMIHTRYRRNFISLSIGRVLRGEQLGASGIIQYTVHVNKDSVHCSNTGLITRDPYWTTRKSSLELIELSGSDKVSLIEISSCSNTESIRDDPYWTSRKNSLELIELSSINKVSLV